MTVSTSKNKNLIGFLLGIIGALLLTLMSWQQNMPFAAWLLLPLLVFSFRHLTKWYLTLPVTLLCIAGKVVAMHGGWDIDLGTEIAFGIMVAAPLLVALYLDRFLHKRLIAFAASLVFPAVYTLLDFLLSFSPVGMTFSLPYVFSRQLILMQGAALLGSWAIGFFIAWSGSTIVTVLNELQKGRKAIPLISAFLAAVFMLLSFGSIKQSLLRPDTATVRVGSISAEHPGDTWAITDAKTPREGSDVNKREFEKMNVELFRLSQKAVDAGAKILLWSEGNYVVYEDQYEEFIAKAQSFTKQNKVYLMAGTLTLHYDSYKNDNLAILFTPDGTIAFRYEKTNSWYPTDSDGIIQKADTPYGRIGSAICFDMDFPAFIRQASDVDIMLVPAYDTDKISPFHTDAALLRGIEYGFAIVRQTNHGESTAADCNGNIRASQNHFTTDERLMISDIPMRGVVTPYEIIGDVFVYVDIAMIIVLIVMAAKKKKTSVSEQ